MVRSRPPGRGGAGREGRREDAEDEGWVMHCGFFWMDGFVWCR